MSSAQLRIFHKDLNRAAFDLEEGRVYRVGNSFECDIYLPTAPDPEDPAFYPTNHFEFSVEHGEIVFSKTHSELQSIDLISKQDRDIDPNTTYHLPGLFASMGFLFAICDAADSWESWLKSIQAPPPPAPEPMPEEPAMTPTEEQHIDNLFFEGTKNKPKTWLDDYPALAQVWTVAQTYGQKAWAHLKNSPWFDKKSPLVLISVCGVLILVGIVGVFAVQKIYLNSIFSGKNQAIEQNMLEIKQMEVNLPPRFNNLKFISDKKDSLTIEGIVKNKADLDYVTLRFSKFKDLVQFKILTADEALRRLTVILKAQNAPWLIPSYQEKNSRFLLQGLLNNMDTINDIELAVSNQIPEISDLDTTQVYSIGDVDKDLDDMIAEAAVASRITVEKNLPAKQVSIQGYLSGAEIERLKASVDVVSKKYMNLISIKLDLKDALASLPFKIVAVNTGGFPSFMTADGQKVFEGGEIEGVKVEKITPTEIVFSGRIALTIKLDDLFGPKGGAAVRAPQ